jgi:tryptophanyl-tRNA synthetase
MRIFSAIQPTGQLHIGNYLGAIKQFVELQKNNECLFSVVDLHAITVPYNVNELAKNTISIVISYLSSGINPEKATLFVQSQIKEHTELAWLLGTITPVGDLMRMTQYKDKSKKLKGRVGAGLLNYPILMAADILLYKTDLVPVGEDQAQHLELARTIARKFNKTFGQTFKEPETMLPKLSYRIMSLNDPTKKMSKSSPEGCLFLFDEPEVIKEKITKAVTDSDNKIIYDPKKKPGISNLLVIYSSFSDQPIEVVERKFRKSNYKTFKKSLISLLIKKLEPLRKKKNELSNREVYIREIIERGRKKAETLAKSTMKEVLQKMGFTLQ